MNYKYFLFLLVLTINAIAQNKSNSIGFKENKGQVIDQNGKPNNAVKYLLNTNGLNVQLKQNGFSYDIYETKKIPIKQRIEDNNTFSSTAKNDKKTADYTLEYVFHRIDIDFVNSNANVELISSEKSKDYDNYYNVPNNPDGIVDVHQYQQITYKNIYPNIDVVFSIPKDSLKAVEYNFVIHPKGKISDIQLKFNGAKTDLVDNKIRMNVRFGEMEETLPASWTEDGMSKKSIRVGYKKIKNNVYGFNTSNSVNGKTVVIDPVPIRLWGTYHAGSDYSVSSYEYTSTSIKTDSYENVIITGKTVNLSGIATAGAFQFTYNNAVNNVDVAYLVKFDKNGQKIWGTYVQNLKYLTEIFDAVINKSNDIYIVGYAFSYDDLNSITTPNSHQEKGTFFNRDGFIMKFNENGQRIWGTFYGGNQNDQIRTACLDSQENLIIGGRTNSTSGIASNSAFQTINKNPFGGCGFFSKFSPSGNFLYGSYFPREVNHLILDSQDNIIFAGLTTNDSQYPNVATPGSHQTVCNHIDGYIAKFNKNGDELWCTNYGGDASFSSSTSEYFDEIKGIGVDGNNNIYIVGSTNSINNISTIGAYKENQTFGGVDVFLAKFSPAGVRQWGTYFGNNSIYFPDTCDSGFVTKEGNIYITGNTGNASEIATPNSYQTVPNGGTDGYFSKFDTNGKLIWSTYYGGNSSDYPGRIFYENNYIYLLGYTFSNNNLTTLGTYKPNGANENFIAKFQDCLSNPIASSNSPVCIGNNLELKASGGTAYSWTGPNGFTSTDQNPIILNATTSNSGEYSCLITGTGGCDDTKKVDIIVGDNQAPIPDLATLPTITGDCNTIITTTPTATDACAGAIVGTTISPILYNLPGTYTIVWNYKDGNGNTSNQNQTVTIANQPLPTVNTPQTFCIQQNATLSSISITGQNVKWYNALNNGNLLSNTISLQNGITYYASQTINGCESARIPVLINIQNTLAPTGDTNQSFCSAQKATLNDIDITGTNIKWYNNSNIELANTTLIGNNATYYATQTVNTCESINKLAVTTTLINTLNANNYKVEFCDENNDGKETLNLSVFNPNLIANPTDNSFSYYTSLVAAENQIANNRINNINNYVLPTGSYTVFVRIDSPNSCYQIVELNLNLYSKPVIPIDDIMPICEGSSIDINAGNGYDNYLWSTGETSPTITIQNPGNYSVTVTNDYDSISCSSTKDFTVKNSTIATITTIETQDWTDNQNTIKVFATGEGDFEYSIDGIHFQDSNEFSNVISGQYTAHVRDKNGCGTVTEEVYLLMYPKFFTPNGDGYNDTWKIKFSDNEKNITIKIFDRYGKLLKALLPDASWNGQLNNQELPATDYWFIATRADGKKYKGHFSLKR